MMTPLIRFLMMFCAPKPTPMAKAPPRKAKATNGTRAGLNAISGTTSSKTDVHPALQDLPKLGDR